MSNPAQPGADCDVAIVGAGPVGQVLGILLGQRGWRVEILERRPEPYPLPRAVHLDDQAARILQAAGIMADLAPLTEVMDAYEWRNGTGDTLLLVEPEGELGPAGWPVAHMFHQPDLDRLLTARLNGLAPGVWVRRGIEVVGLVERSEAVELTVADLAGHRSTRTARWVVGCDGARSRVGQMLEVPYEDLGSSSEWLVVDVLPERPERWKPLNLQVCDPRRPTTAVSGGPGRRRFEFLRLPGEAAESLEAAGRAWELLEPWGVTPEGAVLERQARYQFSARLARRWTTGLVALAGDAAHEMPPFTGQGLCSGLGDAANLAWKLDLVLAGLAPPALVETYDTERGPQVRATIELSVELGRIVCEVDPEAARSRDETLVAAAREQGPLAPPPAPPLGPGIALAGDPSAGHPGRQGVVAHRGRAPAGAGRRRDRLDDLTGGGWVLLSAEADPLSGLGGDTARWWSRLGGRAVHVAPGAALDDVGGTYDRWFADLGARVVLQRPDFAVFGTAPDRAGVEPLLRAARSQLAGGPA